MKCLMILALSTLSASALAAAPERTLLFFTKSSGFEHSVISYKSGQPSHAEKVLGGLCSTNGWKVVFSKDGSKFSPEYLKQFNTVLFYTTGDLTSAGTDGNPPMTAEGKQALLDYVRKGGGFAGTHSASDTFHTNNESKKGPDRYLNHGEKADAYVRLLGGEFIKHNAQQMATVRVVDTTFPGFEKLGSVIKMQEEWYSLKDFSPDIHVLLVQETSTMSGPDYQRPPYPSTWARAEGKGRVFYTSMGHREDVWTNPVFQDILVGGLKWAMGDAKANVSPNLKETAPKALENQAYYEEKPKAPAKAK